MALDTSIPMSYNPSAKLDIEGAYNFAMNRRKNALLEQNAQMEMAEKQNALRQQRELRNFMATADFNDPKQMYRLAAFDPAAAAHLAQMQSSMSTTGKNRADSQTARLKAYRDAMGDADTPEAAMALLTQMHRDPDMAGSPISGLPLEQVLAQVPKKTDATGRVNPNFDQMWQNWHTKASMGMDKYIERTTLTANEQSLAADRASVRTETERHNREMEKNARDRGFDINAYPNLYKAVAEKRIPLSRVNGRTASIYEGVLAENPDINLTDINLDQISSQAGARTAGTTKANIGIASDEANRMIVVARDIIPRVKLSEFRSLNAIENWAKTHTGDRDIVALNASLNSLINSYARAINPKGVGTVSDKNHAREMINSAMSSGQLESVLNVMQQEMEAALGAARAGSGSQKPAAGAAPAASTTGPVKITSDAQFEKLPSGTLFVGPDGKQRRKP